VRAGPREASHGGAEAGSTRSDGPVCFTLVGLGDGPSP
jgi:hypothetical protein